MGLRRWARLLRQWLYLCCQVRAGRLLYRREPPDRFRPHS